MTDDLESLHPNVQWIVAEARRPVVLDDGARDRLMALVASEARPVRTSPVRAWLTEPRHISLAPLASLAAAAGLVGIGVIAGLLLNRDGQSPTERDTPVAVHPQLPDSVGARAVKFVLIAPQAASVSVVGDFNGWDTARHRAVRQPDGTWTAFVPLVPGRHVYSFVVDGQFVSDPTAPMAPDDGYGNRPSVLIVGGSTT
jgi:hypothetical protein